MKKIILFSILGALALPSMAQNGDAIDTVIISNESKRITVPTQIYQMQTKEFGQFRGTYDLSNGQTLVLSRSAGKMYAQLDDQTGHEIVAANQNTFVALDRQLKIKVETFLNGEISELRLLMPATSLPNLAETAEPVLLLAYTKR
jgi:hypothetical protein